MKKLLLAACLSFGVAVAFPPLWYALFPEPIPELPPAGRKVEVSADVGLNVVERGAAPPIVLVHGHPGSAYDWMPLMEALAARGHRVIAYDRAGYGHSDARRGADYSVDANANDLLALLAAEDLQDAVVVGWSYGGATSIAAARKDVTRIACVVLISSVGPGIERREGPPRALVQLVLAPMFAWLERVPPVARRVYGSFSSLAFAPEPVPASSGERMHANFSRPHTLRTFRSEGWDLDGRADLDPGPIGRPMLVIHGDGDLLVPLAVGQELQQRAQRAELWVIQGGGHALPVTRTQALADRISAFAVTEPTTH